MASKRDLTDKAIEGYVGMGNAYIATSPSWFAYKLGEYLKRTGRSQPRDVRMGRGYQIHANDMLFSFDAQDAVTRVN